ncbi:MAG: bacteriohopanetetrol glucosamine biosynthesis glycosyltransferase HpnI [Anaerolineae bacterium]
MLAKVLLMLIITAGWIYWLAALILVYDFFRPRRKEVEASDFAPAVSILKPVKGLDYQAYENFASFCRQDYPEYEIIFGVADAADPVVPIIQRLQRDFPDRRVRLIVKEAFGTNRKASLLHHLADAAQHDILVISDSDMRATPDYLRKVVAPLADAGVGLVTCSYKAGAPLNLTAGLEALHMGATFLPSVMVARKVLNMRFALGATLALRKEDLDAVGGFAAIANYLADDYQLGARIAALGRRVFLSDYIITCYLGATSFLEQWEREVRWMRCSRVSRPLEYPGLLLTFCTPLSLILALISRFDAVSLRFLMVSLVLRWVMAWLVSLRTENSEIYRWLHWLPARDLLSALTWCTAGVGRRVHWRGESFILQADGQMVPAAEEVAENKGHL